MVGILIYKFIEDRCKHSRCSSTSSCLKCAVDNYDTERGESNQTHEVQDAVQPEKSVPEMQARNNPKIPERHFALDNIELRDPESLSGHASKRDVAVGTDPV